MSDDAPDSLIPYDQIVQEALRAVVGSVLGEIEAGGGTLPGNHHFYITFKTHAPGVSVPASLRERFPDEMTIVLQNKFWNLNVRDDGFAVGLSFNQVPAELDIPYAAITQFVDPAVQIAQHDLRPPPHNLANRARRTGRPIRRYHRHLGHRGGFVDHLEPSEPLPRYRPPSQRSARPWK